MSSSRNAKSTTDAPKLCIENSSSKALWYRSLPCNGLSSAKASSKQQFDPFRRRDRISFFYQPDRSFETTIGQLNFFRWMLQNQVLEYVTEHAAEIEKDMLASSPTAGSGVGETNEGGKEEEQDQEEQGHQEEHHSTHSTPSKVHAPPPTRAHVSSLHGGRRRAPQAQCRVTQSMTRVGGQHTVAFE